MARPNRPADPFRVGAHLAEVLAPDRPAIDKQTEGLHDRVPLDPDIEARALAAERSRNST
jgi:hypothetical protein